MALSVVAQSNVFKNVFLAKRMTMKKRREDAQAAPMRPIDGLDCVLFLDVDGVLHALKPNGLCRDATLDELTARTDAELDLPEEATASVLQGEFNSACMEQLARCVSQSGASIVLSSTWRETPPQRRAVDAQLVRYGMATSVASTCTLPLVAGGGRSAEILAWVEAHRPRRWVALDDTELRLPDGHFVRTDPACALDLAGASRAVELLACQASSASSASSQQACEPDEAQTRQAQLLLALGRAVEPAVQLACAGKLSAAAAGRLTSGALLEEIAEIAEGGDSTIAACVAEDRARREAAQAEAARDPDAISTCSQAGLWRTRRC